MIGTELTWTATLMRLGNIYHQAESKAKLGLVYVVYESLVDGMFHVSMPRQWWNPIEGEGYATAVDAKQACQRHEDTLAERGDACRSK